LRADCNPIKRLLLYHIVLWKVTSTLTKCTCYARAQGNPVAVSSYNWCTLHSHVFI